MATREREVSALLKAATKADLEAFVGLCVDLVGARLVTTDLRRIIGRRRLDAIEAKIDANGRAFDRAVRRRDLAKVAALAAESEALQRQWDAALEWAHPRCEAAQDVEVRS